MSGVDDSKIPSYTTNELTVASSSMTIREALVEASSFLAMQGVTDGRFDAELLMQHILGWDRTRLLLDWHELFPGKYVQEWAQLITRRGAGEPVQYVIGEQEFYGLPFVVNHAVLIPRPETELLVEAIMKHGRDMWPAVTGEDEKRVSDSEVRAESQLEGLIERQANRYGELDKSDADLTERRGPLVVDIGTGSGAISVSLAVFNPSWQLVAVDLSPQAIEVASRNVERNKVVGRVKFLQGDLLEPVIKLGLQVDILVSNPPYIPSTDIAGLQREVREHEPMLALDGGEDGLYCYRTMLEQMKQLVVIPRLVGFEVGFDQAQAVASLMKQCGWWDHIEIIQDYAGIERHVIGYQTG